MLEKIWHMVLIGAIPKFNSFTHLLELAPFMISIVLFGDHVSHDIYQLNERNSKNESMDCSWMYLLENTVFH